MASQAAPEPTLVGLCDAEVDPQRHGSSFRTNKVGGLPDWPPGVFRKSPLCGRCGGPLAQVVQVYCPLEASPYHRNLHLFACTRAACSGRSDCWKVLRSQSLEEEEREEERPPPAQEAPRSATEWCDTADDWGMEEEEEEEKGGGGGGGGGGGVEKEVAAAPHTEGEQYNKVNYINNVYFIHIYLFWMFIIYIFINVYIYVYLFIYINTYIFIYI